LILKAKAHAQQAFAKRPYPLKATLLALASCSFAVQWSSTPSHLIVDSHSNTDNVLTLGLAWFYDVDC
jgi:hypothetical protein